MSKYTIGLLQSKALYTLMFKFSAISLFLNLTLKIKLLILKEIFIFLVCGMKYAFLSGNLN